MKKISKGFFAAAVVIALLASGCGCLYAQLTPPSPGQANIPGTDFYAAMDMTFSLQCVEQVAPNPPVGTVTRFATRSFHLSEKNVISLMSQLPACYTGTYPADLKKARLYYVYGGGPGGNSLFNVYVSSDLTDPDKTVMISACVAVDVHSDFDAVVWSGTMDTGTSKVSLNGQYPMQISLDIPDGEQPGLQLAFTGNAKEAFNLPPLKNGNQTLTDMINLNGDGNGRFTSLSGDTPFLCTGVVHVSGKVSTAID